MKTVNLAIALAIVLAGGAGAYYLVRTAQSASPAVGEGHSDEHGAAHGNDGHETEGPAAHAEAPAGEHGEETAEVEISAEAARANGLATAVAGPAVIQQAKSLPGQIALNQNTLVHVVPRLSGVAREVAKNLGDEVKQGDLLAIIESRELADAKGEYLGLIEQRVLAASRFEREQKLVAQKISPQEDFLAAKQALAELDIQLRASRQKLQALGVSNEQVDEVASGKMRNLTEYRIHAPSDGTVIERHLNIGEAVEGNADAFVLANLATVWVEVTVYAQDLKNIREDQAVTVRSEDMDLEAKGSITYIGALVGQDTRTATAYVDLPNEEGQWRPGLYVTVALSAEEFPVPVAVPAAAIQTLNDAPVVFVKHGEHYEGKAVKIGRTDGSMTEITEGLLPGDEYVSENSYLVKADIEKAGAAHEH